MKRTKVESNLEKKFLAAMVTNKQFLAGASVDLDLALFPMRYAQQIAGWCVHHFKMYDDAPGRGIEAIYHSWVENEKPDKDDVDAVEAVLDHLSDKFEDTSLNVPHLLDELSKYLTLQKISRLKDDLQAHVEYGRAQEAVDAISAFRGTSVRGKVGYDITTDRQAIRDIFKEGYESVIEFPGVAGQFLNHGFRRDSLVGLQGVEKRGKTFWCIEFMYRALRGGRKVAMFQVGDLSKMQLDARMAIRMAGVPIDPAHCKKVRVPRKITLTDLENGRKKASVEFECFEDVRPLDAKEALRAQKRFRRRYKLPELEGKRLMMSVHPMSSINVAGIHAILEQWKYEIDFVPDVIIIDYADILAPEVNRKEGRDQVNDTWKALRTLSQNWHACVIAPTQSSAKAYGAYVQTMNHFSEDKRKMAAVTGFLGLNQTDEEKENQVMRLNWVHVRESQFSPNDCLFVAQCLSRGEALRLAAR